MKTFSLLMLSGLLAASWAVGDTTYTIAQQTGYREYSVKIAYLNRTGTLPSDVFRRINLWNGASISGNTFSHPETVCSGTDIIVCDTTVIYSGFTLNKNNAQDTFFLKADTAIHYSGGLTTGNRDTSWYAATQLPLLRQTAEHSDKNPVAYGAALWRVGQGYVVGYVQTTYFKPGGYKGILYVKFKDGPCAKIQISSVHDTVTLQGGGPGTIPLDYTLHIGIDFTGQGVLPIQQRWRSRRSSFQLSGDPADSRFLDLNGRAIQPSKSIPFLMAKPGASRVFVPAAYAP